MRPPSGISGLTTSFISPAVSLTNLPWHLIVVTLLASSSVDFSTSRRRGPSGGIALHPYIETRPAADSSTRPKCPMLIYCYKGWARFPTSAKVLNWVPCSSRVLVAAPCLQQGEAGLLVRLKSAGPEKSASAAGLARTLTSRISAKSEGPEIAPTPTSIKNPREYLYCSVNTTGVIIPESERKFNPES